MDELKEILCLHLKRYPQMQAEDVLKLIYQQVFGGGHLIQNFEKAFERLKAEYDELQSKQIQTDYLEEPIGNSVVRVYLTARTFKESDLMPLCESFIESASCMYGTPIDFDTRVEYLLQHFEEFSFSFPKETLESYWREIQKYSYAPISHSELYRKLYHPAYRIVKKTVC